MPDVGIFCHRFQALTWTPSDSFLGLELGKSLSVRGRPSNDVALWYVVKIVRKHVLSYLLDLEDGVCSFRGWYVVMDFVSGKGQLPFRHEDIMAQVSP